MDRIAVAFQTSPDRVEVGLAWSDRPVVGSSVTATSRIVAT